MTYLIGLFLCAGVGVVGMLGFTTPASKHVKVPPERAPVQRVVDDYPGSVASHVARGVRTGVSGPLKVPYVSSVMYVARHAARSLVVEFRRHRARGGVWVTEIDSRLEILVGAATSIAAGRHSLEARRLAAALLIS